MASTKSVGRTIIVKNLSPKVCREDVELYMEDINPGSQVADIQYQDSSKTTALVTYEEDIQDFKTLVTKASGHSFTIELPVCNDTVLVTNIPTTFCKDTILLYFESVRSGGGDVVDVWMLPNRASAVVQFENPAVVGSVLRKIHRLENIVLQVQVYEKQTLPFPPVDYPAKRHYEAVSTPSPYKGSDNAFQRSKKDYSPEHTYTPKSFSSTMPGYSARKFDTLRHAWGEENPVRGSSERAAAIQTEAPTSTENTRKSGTLKPFVEIQHDPVPKTCIIKKKLKEDTDVQNEDVSSVGTPSGKLKKSPEIPQRVIEQRSFEMSTSSHKLLRKNFAREFTDTEVDIKLDDLSNKITIRGCGEEYKNMIIQILSFKENVAVKNLYLDDRMIQLLDTANGKRFLSSMETDQCLAEVSGNFIEITAVNRETAEEMKEKIKNHLKEEKIEIEDDHQDAINSHDWWEMKKRLEKNALLCLDKHSKNVEVYGVESDVRKAIQEVTEFLLSNKGTKQEVVLKKGCWRLLKEYHNAEVENMCLLSSGQRVVHEFHTNDKQWWVTFEGRGNAPEIVKDSFDDLKGRICYKKFEKQNFGLYQLMHKGSGKEWIQNVERRYSCVIEVRQSQNEGEIKTYRPKRQQTKPKVAPKLKQSSYHEMPSRSYPSEVEVSFDKCTLKVRKGNLVTQEGVDVLVDPVVGADLWKGGAISKAFAKLGTQELQKRVEQAGGIKPDTVIVTASENCGELKCKFVFHWKYAAWRPNKGEQKLRNMIKCCLTEANNQGVSSIAFPPIGCGNMKFPLNTVAKCLFDETKSFGENNPSSTLKTVHIVVYDARMHSSFCGEISRLSGQPLKQAVADEVNVDKAQDSTIGVEASTGEDEEATENQPGFFTQVYNMFAVSSTGVPEAAEHFEEEIKLDCPVTTFHINCMSTNTISDAWESLETQMDNNYHKQDYTNENIKYLSEERRKKIQDLASPDLSVFIDQKNSIVYFSGERTAVLKSNYTIVSLTTIGGIDFKKIQEAGDRSMYLKKLMEYDMLPDYWTKFGSKCRLQEVIMKSGGQKVHQVSLKGPLYDVLKTLVLQTWQADKVGTGRDAANLQHSNIEIKSIKRIENPKLYLDYVNQQKKMISQVLVKPISSLEDLKQEPAASYKLKLDELNKLLLPEVNEHWLFHGSNKSNLNAIINQGLDFRMAKEGGMFGRGIYLTDSSTKADQYADDKRSREDGDHYMFIVRVCLGNTYVCPGPMKYPRAPCIYCNDAMCVDPTHNVFYDAVIGDKADGGRILLFREFIVYHLAQCYPEFVVQYIRK